MRRRSLLIGAAAAPLVGVRAQVASSWRAAEPLPLNTQEIYPAVHESRLYVAGGIAARAGVPYFTDRCVSFDGAAWREEASLPESLHHAALVSDGDSLLLVGGFNGGYTHVWRMRAEVYRLTADGWLPAGALPAPQAEGVLSRSPAGEIHLVTGQQQRGEANRERSDHVEVHTHLIRDRADGRWREAEPIPTARNSATGGWVGGLLVVTGGRTAAGNLSVTEIYDPQADVWYEGAPLPLPQAGTASVVVDNSLIVFGGEIFVPEAGVFAEVWRYRLDEDRWEALPPLPTPRHGLGAGVLNDEIYVVGGATEPGGRGTSSANEALYL